MTRAVYKATNIETGEVIVETAYELSERFGVIRESIYNCAYRCENLRKVWMIERAEDKKVGKGYPVGTLEEWDKLTGPIREYIRQRDERRAGNGKKRHRI